ncbi:hypothetical protein GH733_019504 [Mirounga leonina]|nr:hypothetical protein GH733_019504 [Mirounga leonina]
MRMKASEQERGLLQRKKRRRGGSRGRTVWRASVSAQLDVAHPDLPHPPWSSWKEDTLHA